MFDLKVMNSALEQLEEERGIPKEKVYEAIEAALAAAYKRDYGKREQNVRAELDRNSGTAKFYQVKLVVDDSMLKIEDVEGSSSGESEISTSPDGEGDPEDTKVKWSEERHMMLEDAQRIQADIKVGEEMIFPLEDKGDYGRIAAQTAKQVIRQKIREAEKGAVLEEFGKRAGDIVSGTVQRVERGNTFVDLGRTTGVLYRDEQIQSEHYRTGERIRALLLNVEESPRGIAVRLSRSHPDFVRKLFEIEVPEIVNGSVEVKGIAREAGARTKIAVVSNDDSIDAVGSLVGQRGVRVNTVISELGGEKIDIIEWSDLPEHYIANALSPGEVQTIELDEETQEANIHVSPDQLSLVIGRGGQNVRLAARLTGWKLDIETPEKRKYEDDANGASDSAEGSDGSSEEESEIAEEGKGKGGDTPGGSEDTARENIEQGSDQGEPNAGDKSGPV